MHAKRTGGKQRLDVLLVDRGLAPSRVKARALVLAGLVRSGDERLDKPGSCLPGDVPLRILEPPRFVSRGGFKLDGALLEFGVDATSRDALDVGASTGGFTQALLERGVGRVVALDVGRGQLDWNLRNDPRVHPLEGLNARYLRPGDLPFAPALAVVDVSFISLRLVLPAVVSCLACPWEVIALIKPQFEVGRGRVGRGGIVRDPALHRLVLHDVVDLAYRHHWCVAALCASTVRGARGNQEFFIHLRHRGPGLDPEASAGRIAALAPVPKEPER